MNFSEETLQARKDWDGIFKVLREKKNKTLVTNTIHSKITLHKLRKDTVTEKQKLRKLIITRPSLQEIPKEFFKLKGC